MKYEQQNMLNFLSHSLGATLQGYG